MTMNLLSQDMKDIYDQSLSRINPACSSVYDSMTPEQREIKKAAWLQAAQDAAEEIEREIFRAGVWQAAFDAAEAGMPGGMPDGLDSMAWLSGWMAGDAKRNRDTK